MQLKYTRHPGSVARDGNFVIYFITGIG